MNRRRLPLLLLPLLALACCSEALYPPRPPQMPSPPIADPPPSRVVMHITVSQAGLQQLLDAAVPQTGEGLFTLIGTRRYGWKRTPFEVRFDNATGKIGVRAQIDGEAALPATTAHFSLVLSAEAQPVLSSDYQAQLQSPVVSVTSDDRVLRAAEWGGGVLSNIRDQIDRELRKLRIDLRPVLAKTYVGLARPLPLPIGNARACVNLGIQSIEAGPTVLAGGLEKDLAVVLAPSVTLPCTTVGQNTTLPPLQNLANLPPGPFEVIIPVAATYDELQKAMTQAFTGGKLFFSKEYPDLYLEHPEIYATGGEIVTKLHLDGFVRKGFKVRLSGDLYLSGHPQVRDNELEVPDMQPTVETRDAMLKLKTSMDAEGLKRQVRQALRLDIGARLLAVRNKLQSELSIPAASGGKGPAGCLRAEVGRIEVSGIYAHDSYMRLYLKISARAAAYLPCPAP